MWVIFHLMASPELIQYLKDVFKQRKKKNPRYSQRALASSIGLHSAALSTLLAGKRKISTELASRILDKLGVDDQQERLRILGPSIGVKPAEPPAYTDVDLARFAVVRDWEHSAILAALEIDPETTDERLADKLDLPVERIRTAAARLESVGLLERRDGGRHSATPHQATIPDVPSEDVREAHRQFMEKAAESLFEDPREVRDISGITLTLNPSKLEEARDAIRDFRRRLARLVDDGGADREVYRLNIQLFPLVKEHRR